MSGRRSHQRFAVATPWDGAVRVLRDVVVDRTERDELLAVTHIPAVTGEDMSLELIGGGQSLALKVRVLESRPVIIDGTVRHRVRLALADVESGQAVPESAAMERESEAMMVVARVAEAG